MATFKNQPISENFPVQKMAPKSPKFLLHFQIHIDVLILCRNFEQIPSSNFRVMTIFKNQPIYENFPVQKMALKSPKFLLHFQIHIDVLILCRNFEQIPSSNFRVMTIFKNQPIFEKYPVIIAHAFFQKMAPKSPKIFITFSDTH